MRQFPTSRQPAQSSPPDLVRALPRALSSTQIRYVAVAGAVSLGYLALVAGGLLLDMHYMLAIVLAQVVAIAVAFPLYRTLVFASKGSLRHDLIRFLSVWSSGMAAGLLATPALVELFAMPPLLAQVIAIALVAIGSYLGHRYVTFPDGTGRDAR